MTGLRKRPRAGQRRRPLSRTVSYAILPGLLAATAAASTLLVATLFQPLRRRIHAAVDRCFNRARADADETAAAFRARLRDRVGLATVAAEVDATVRRALASRPETVRV